MKHLQKEIQKQLDTMAEVYCQLGESGRERTRPMKAGLQYTDNLLSLFTSAMEEVIGYPTHDVDCEFANTQDEDDCTCDRDTYIQNKQIATQRQRLQEMTERKDV